MDVLAWSVIDPLPRVNLEVVRGVMLRGEVTLLDAHAGADLMKADEGVLLFLS